MKSIAIVGLGYLSLPLSLQFARSGAAVLGLDIDPVKTDAINSGRSYIKHISGAQIDEWRLVGRLEASTDFSRIGEVNAVIRCVPTPLNHFRKPDLSYVLETGQALAPFLKKGSLVVLESIPLISLP